MAGKKPQRFKEELHLRITEEMKSSIESIAYEEDLSLPEAARHLVGYGIKHYKKLKQLESNMYNNQKEGPMSDTQTG